MTTVSCFFQGDLLTVEGVTKVTGGVETVVSIDMLNRNVAADRRLSKVDLESIKTHGSYRL